MHRTVAPPPPASSSADRPSLPYPSRAARAALIRQLAAWNDAAGEPHIARSLLRLAASHQPLTECRQEDRTVVLGSSVGRSHRSSLLLVAG